MATAISERAESGVRGAALGLRIMPQAMQPGGAVMTNRVLEGAAVDRTARVLALAPGFSPTTARVIRRWPREWVGVEPLEAAAKDVRAVIGPRRPTPLGILDRLVHGVDPSPSDVARVIEGALDETQLRAESITAAYGEGILSSCESDGATAILTELARVLRPGGRCAFHELTLGYTATPRVLSALAPVGLRPLTIDAWRAACSAAGLVPCGETRGRLVDLGRVQAIAALGVSGTLARARALARDRGAIGMARQAAAALHSNAAHLEALVVLAERPLIAGLRVPAPA